MKRVWILLLLAGMLVACGGNGEEAEETASDEGAVLATTLEGGQNENGTFYRGAVDAPVTFIDYSDYL